MKKRLTLGFVVGIATLIAIFFGITSKAYPIATVNDSLISTRSFQIAGTAAQTYYTQVGTLYGVFASTTEAEFESQMRQVALQALIEDRLVNDKLQTLYEVEPLNASIALRVSEALASSSQTTPEAIQGLFGLTVDEFSEVVLAPRARAELLQTELAKSGIDFEVWLQAALNDAQVSITAKDLVWAAGRVELTGERSYTAEVKDIFSQIASTTDMLRVVSSTPEESE